MRILSEQEFANCEIPSEHGFKIAKRRFEEELIRANLGDGIYGGLGYGSLQRGDYNEGSDADYFLIITDKLIKVEIKKFTEQIYKETYVLFNPIVVEKNHAERGIHTIDRSFREHLELCKNLYGYIGEDPFTILKQSQKNLKEACKSSIADYLNKINRGMTTYCVSEEKRLTLLKYVVEKPFHAMRVMIQYVKGTIAPEGENEFADTKKYIISEYKKLGLENALMNDIEQINKVSNEYIELLRFKQISPRCGSANQEPEYRALLDRIEALAPFAYRFIDESTRMMK